MVASLKPVSYILNTSVTRSNSLADNLGACGGTFSLESFLAGFGALAGLCPGGTPAGVPVRPAAVVVVVAAVDEIAAAVVAILSWGETSLILSKQQPNLD